MKGNFDAYVLQLLNKMIQNRIVDRSNARDFTVDHFECQTAKNQSNSQILFHKKSLTAQLIYNDFESSCNNWP